MQKAHLKLEQVTLAAGEEWSPGITDLIITRDSDEARIIELHNVDVLRFAARNIVWELRNPEQSKDNGGPKGQITFQTLGLKTPSFQYNILTKFAARITSALDDLSTGGRERADVTAHDPILNTAVCSDFMGAFIDRLRIFGIAHSQLQASQIYQRQANLLTEFANMTSPCPKRRKEPIEKSRCGFWVRARSGRRRYSIKRSTGERWVLPSISI